MYILGTSATAHWGLLNLLCTPTGGTDWLDLEFGAMVKKARHCLKWRWDASICECKCWTSSFTGLPPVFCLLVIFGFLEMG